MESGDRLTVLLLLAVSGRLFQSTDDERRRGGNNLNLGLTVLDGQLDSDFETFPFSSLLGNIFSDLSGIETEGTKLGSQGR